MEKQKKWSFSVAYYSLPYNEMAIVRKEIEAAIGIKSKPCWYQRLHGIVEPRISEYLAIQRIFKKRGIKAFQN
jgi:hypothetical protein